MKRYLLALFLAFVALAAVSGDIEARDRRVPIAAAAGGATPAFRSKSVIGTSGGTSLTATEPAGAAENDILFWWQWTNTTTGTVTPPAGWTQFYDNTGGTTFHRVLGFWIRRGSSAPDLTMAWVNSQAAEAVVLAYSGAKTSGNPYDDLQITTQSAVNPANPDGPSVTTTGSNRMVISFGVSGQPFRTWTAPSGYTMRHTGAFTPNFFDELMVAEKEVAAAGAENPGAFAGSNGNADIGSATISLSP